VVEPAIRNDKEHECKAANQLAHCVFSYACGRA
jgi:hypothetical protein